MNTTIWQNNHWKKIQPTDFVNTTRNVHSFCVSNSLPNRLLKSQGGWYILNKEGVLTFISESLNKLTYQDLFEILSFD